MAVTVLLTGFGPFPGAPVNPTGPLVRALATARPRSLARIRRTARVLRTSYAAVDELPTLIRRQRPDVILMFGLAVRSRVLRIERKARNVASATAADVDGCTRAAGRISAEAAAFLTGRAPFAHLLAAARAAGVPARLSDDAGTYLCNYAYWRALAATADADQPPLTVFVHVPPADRPGGMTFADLVRVGERMLLVLAIAAGRRAESCAIPARQTWRAP
jgi:pyroglutamyl-peptidase